MANSPGEPSGSAAKTGQDSPLARSTSPAAGLVSFRLENGKHSQLVQALENQGFLLRTIANPDCVRACLHYFTSEDEIDRLVAAIKQSI